MTQTKPQGTSLVAGRWKAYPAYKDSGVEWLGKIPEHWEVKRLKQVFRVINGATPKSGEPTYWDGEIPWVTPEDLGSLSNKIISSTSRMITEEGYRSCGTSLVPMGSLTLSTRAPIGHLAIAGVALCTNQGCRSLVFQRNQEILFFFYQLQAIKQELQSWGQGSTFLELGKSKLEAINILVPSHSEQRTIATFLDRETTKINILIARKERLIELLQEKRSALISHAVTKGLDPTVPMKDSGVEWLGEIPAHWEVKRIAMAACKITNGYVGPTRDILVNEGIRYLQSLHIKNGEIRFNKRYFVTEEWSNLHSKSILCEGDVLVVQTGDIGQCCAVPKEFVGCNCHALIIIQLKDGLGSGFYLSAFLRSDYGRNMLLYAQTGALHPHLECGKVREIKILLPPPEEQNRIMEYLDRETAKIDALISKIREAIEKLKEYNTALISAAVTGKIDVREMADNSTEKSEPIKNS